MKPIVNFEEHQDAIVLAAGEHYRSERDHVEPDPGRSTVNMLPHHLGDLSPRAMADALIAQAEVNVAARHVGHIASLTDTAESGGFIRSRAAKVEIVLTRLAHRQFVRGSLVPGGPVDKIRGVKR